MVNIANDNKYLLPHAWAGYKFLGVLSSALQREKVQGRFQKYFVNSGTNHRYQTIFRSECG